MMKFTPEWEILTEMFLRTERERKYVWQQTMNWRCRGSPAKQGRHESYRVTSAVEWSVKNIEGEIPLSG